MTFKEAADQVIRLAEARNAEHQAAQGCRPSTVALALGQIHDELPARSNAPVLRLPADFPAEIRDSITAGALSRRALIKPTASK